MFLEGLQFIFLVGISIVLLAINVLQGHSICLCVIYFSVVATFFGIPFVRWAFSLFWGTEFNFQRLHFSLGTFHLIQGNGICTLVLPIFFGAFQMSWGIPFVQEEHYLRMRHSICIWDPPSIFIVGIAFVLFVLGAPI